MNLADDRSDQGLVADALAERQAFGPIIRRYEAPLTRYVARIVGRSEAEAQDIVQEAFIKAFVNLRAYDRGRAFAPWLYRIAHNEAVGFLRRHKARVQIGGDDGALILERLAADDDPQENLGRERMTQSVRRAIDELPGAYRHMLILRYLEERSYTEISDILRMPPGTVATRINRAKQRLRAVLQADGGPAADAHRRARP